MKPLGQKMEKMYPSAVDGNEEVHPSVRLPSSMFDKKYSVGDKVNVEFNGVIEGSDKQGHHVKFLKGQECGTPAEEDNQEGDTLLGKK